MPDEKQKALKSQEPESCAEMERSLRELKLLSDEAASRLQNLDREIAAATVGSGFDELQADYTAWDEVVEYLRAVREQGKSAIYVASEILARRPD